MECMPLKRKRPIEVMRDSPQNRERGWLKAPLHQMSRASTVAGEKAGHVHFSRKPLDSDRMRIHTHPGLPLRRKRYIAWPSFGDLGLSYGDYKHNKIRTGVVGVRDGSYISGITFFQFREGKNFIKDYDNINDAYENLLDKLVHASRSNDSKTQRQTVRRLINLLKKAGIKIRFVPNKKAGYAFKDGRFVKGIPMK